MGDGMNLTCTLCTLPDLKGGGLQRQKKNKNKIKKKMIDATEKCH